MFFERICRASMLNGKVFTTYTCIKVKGSASYTSFTNTLTRWHLLYMIFTNPLIRWHLFLALKRITFDNPACWPNIHNVYIFTCKWEQCIIYYISCTSFTNTLPRWHLCISRSDRNNNNKLSYQEAIMSFFVGVILEEQDEKSQDCKYSDMAAIKVRSCWSNRMCLCLCVSAT